MTRSPGAHNGTYVPLPIGSPPCLMMSSLSQKGRRT